MDKDEAVYIYIHTNTHTHRVEYYSAIKKNEILPFATIWIDLVDIMLINMSDRRRQIPYDFTYMWNLKKNENVEVQT